MKCKGRLRLEKLIMGENPIKNNVSMFTEIVRYVELQQQPQHISAARTMRIVYNMALADMADTYDVSKNAMRHNINYIRSWMKHEAL